MVAVSGGIGAPQIGVDLQLVVFGTDEPHYRYPDEPAIPRTVLINPVIEAMTADEHDDWESRHRYLGSAA